MCRSVPVGTLRKAAHDRVTRDRSHGAGRAWGHFSRRPSASTLAAMALTPGRVLAGRIFCSAGIGFLVVLVPSILAGGLSTFTAAILAGLGVCIVVWVWFWMRALGSE